MKIVFIINSLSYKSGTERVSCHLANLCVEKLGYDVSILNRDTTHDKVAYSLNNEVKVYDLFGNNSIFYRKIQNYLSTEKPDFVVVHNMGRLSLLCSFLNIGTAKLISMEHVAFESRPKWVQFLSKILYKKIDKVVTLTHQDNLSYQSWFKECYIIYNISPFSILDELKFKRLNKIIAIGRLTYQKNFQALLQAWYLIQSHNQDWLLEIYGTGNDELELRKFIDDYQIRNVKLMGQSDNVEEIYQQSSIFVMSSRFEGLPMVLIEAQTFGLPIISFDCPHGPAEVINHEKNGLLVENQNVEALAQAMFELMNDDKKRNQYSLQALKDAERFQENNILRLWRNILE